MTKEDLKDMAFVCDGQYNQPVVDLEYALSIIDDFESRICENCKHLDKSLSICWMKVEIDGYMGKDKNFGCNEFERKDK